MLCHILGQHVCHIQKPSFRFCLKNYIFCNSLTVKWIYRFTLFKIDAFFCIKILQILQIKNKIKKNY